MRIQQVQIYQQMNFIMMSEYQIDIFYFEIIILDGQLYSLLFYFNADTLIASASGQSLA